MSTVPVLIVGGHVQTDYIQSKTLGFKLKTLDFTLVDPVNEPALHNAVSLDVPEWHGRVSTIESYPFRAADGSDHRWVKITATNKRVAPADTAPFGISDAPNYTTTFPYKDLGVIRTLADQTDLASAELRILGIVYEPGLIPGMTVNVTSAAESLSAEPVIITEMSVNWLKSDAAEYHIEMSDTGVPPVTLGGIIKDASCDCAPFSPGDCVDSIGELECLARDGNVYSYTEGGTFPPNELLACVGGFESYSTERMQYFSSGDYSNEYPEAGIHNVCSEGGVCQFLFESGGVVYTSGGSSVFHRITLIGPGTLVISTRVHPGGLLCGTSSPSVVVTATAYVSGTISVVDTDSQTVGTSLTIVIPNDSECAHYIDLNGTGPWGDAGFIWTPAPTGDLCTPDPGQPIVPEQFTGDGSTDTFHLVWPYMPGSLEVYVEGVDWSDQVIEDDPAAGDFSLAYPPPLATDAEPNIEVHYRYPH